VTHSRLLSRIAQLFRPVAASTRPSDVEGDEPGRFGDTATVEIVPPGPGGLRISYVPDVDGEPDAGEIIWTWVPYDERDGRGKDRPVLVIAREDHDWVYAVRLTSKSHDGDRDYLALGSGSWDARGRPSWVDIEQIYRVHRTGVRREASVLEPDRFARVAAALGSRYGWSAEGTTA
jgi:hypothetical protein